MTARGGRSVLLAAGGTGGHLFPAESLAHTLAARGWAVELATDERADRYGAAFPARKVHLISAATVTGRSPIALARTGARLGRGFLQSLSVIQRLKPAVAVGFGGYPTVPPLMAARFLGVPIVLHEQNAVLGWANRLLAPRAAAIATGFPSTGRIERARGKPHFTGNPVRPAVLAAAAAGARYVPPAADGPFDLLVFGGSQGARVFADLAPAAIERLDPALRSRLRVVQQARPEDAERTRAAYAALGVAAEIAPFFTDMPMRMANAHLVVCRSGASTVAELSVIGRPAILVPLPHARDQDQAANARVLAEAGAAWPIAQSALDPDRLAREITDLSGAPERLAAAAEAARGTGRPDAVERLADLVEEIAAPKPGDAS